jgi:hypothetical protein
VKWLLYGLALFLLAGCGTAHSVDGDLPPFYQGKVVHVSVVDENQGFVLLTGQGSDEGNDYQNFSFTINEQTNIEDEEGKETSITEMNEGDQLLVWLPSGDASIRESYPPQANAGKIVIVAENNGGHEERRR